MRTRIVEVRRADSAARRVVLLAASSIGSAGIESLELRYRTERLSRTFRCVAARSESRSCDWRFRLRNSIRASRACAYDAGYDRNDLRRLQAFMDAAVTCCLREDRGLELHATHYDLQWAQFGNLALQKQSRRRARGLRRGRRKRAGRLRRATVRLRSHAIAVVGASGAGARGAWFVSIVAVAARFGRCERTLCAGDSARTARRSRFFRLPALDGGAVATRARRTAGDRTVCARVSEISTNSRSSPR